MYRSTGLSTTWVRIFSFFKMESTASSAVDVYKKLAAIPFPMAATVLPFSNQEMISIHTAWRSRDIVKSESTKFFKEFFVKNKERNIHSLFSSLPQDANLVINFAISKTGKKLALMKKKNNSDDSMFLEIWSSSRKEKIFDLSDRKEHGKIIENNSFGCLEWSANEKYILYTAEAKKKKTESYFKDAWAQKESEKKEEIVKGEENMFYEDWGETLAGLHHSVLCVIEVETGFIDILNLNEENSEVSVSEAIWGPNDETIVFIGYKEFPRRLSPIYCQNRRSKLYSVNWKSKAVDNYSDESICVNSPRFNSNFDAIFFLENRAGGPHKMCSMLRKLDWKTKTLSTIVDIVNSASGDEFPGIFSLSLPKRCWSSNNKFMFFTSYWRSYMVILCVDTETSQVDRLKIEISGKAASDCSVLDVWDDLIVASVSAPNSEPFLVIGKFDLKDKNVVSWSELDASGSVLHKEMNWIVETLIPNTSNPKYPNVTYDIIVIYPKENTVNAPIIMWPHGGPHSVFTTSFDILSALFVKLGYIVCKVNYRGSIGFGEDSIKSLLGNVGSQDIADVQQAAVTVKNLFNIVDSNFAVFGGSHGGFIAAHLSGQYPNFYKAAILRNPVIDMIAMAGVTDIPDWVWVEAGHGDEFDFKSVVNPNVFKNIWEKSPIKYVNNVTVPTLLLLGKKDLRVPSSQGLAYYHCLRARNVPVKLFVYDDNHGLTKVDVEGDHLIHSILWLKQYLDPEQ